MRRAFARSFTAPLELLVTDLDLAKERFPDETLIEQDRREHPEFWAKADAYITANGPKRRRRSRRVLAEVDRLRTTEKDG